MRKFLAIFLLLLCPLAKAEEMSVSIFSHTNLAELIKTHPILQTHANKFVLASNGQLKISLSGKNYPRHDELGKDLKILTAGYIQVHTPTKIELNNRSKAFCPKFASLKEVEKFLQNKKGEPKLTFILKDAPNPDCKN